MSLTKTSSLKGYVWRSHSTRPDGPAMLGTLTIDGSDRKATLAAWVKQCKTSPDKTYLSVQVELSRDVKYYGSIFLNTKKKTPCADYDYVGQLDLTPFSMLVQGFRKPSSPKLKIAGWYYHGVMDVLIES